MGFDVFISHSSKDKAIADGACASLEAAGIRCWIAPRDIMPGTEYGASIVDALDRCRVLVLIFSSNANESPQLRREVEHAVSRAVPIVPVRIENVVPTKSMAYFVESVHWLDAMTPPVESHFQRLAEVVKAMLQAGQAGVTAKVRAGPSAVAATGEVTAPSAAAQASSVSEGQPGRQRSSAGKPQRSLSPALVAVTSVAAVLLLACAALVTYRYLAWKPGAPVPPSVATRDVPSPQQPGAAAAPPVQPPPAAPAKAPNAPVQTAAGAAADSNKAVRNQNPVDGGMPVTVGDTYEMVSAAYKTYDRPSPWSNGKEECLYLKDQGVEFFFDSSNKITAIHFVAPWPGSIRGVKLGDTPERVKSLLGEPAASQERFGGIMLALVYRWPYTLTVEFHVKSNKVEIIMLE